MNFWFYEFNLILLQQIKKAEEFHNIEVAYSIISRKVNEHYICANNQLIGF